MTDAGNPQHRDEAAAPRAAGPVLSDPSGSPVPVFPPSANGWMITFADVLALLLTFFVMMYAMNDVREDEWQGFVRAMTGHFNPANPPADFQLRDGISDTSVFETRGMDLGYLDSLITTRLADAGAAGDVSLHRDADRLSIRISGAFTKGGGRLDMSPRAAAIAGQVGQVLRTLSNRVSVTGHAAHREGEAGFASAWELSLAMAIMVADNIRRSGYERDIVMLGRGDSRIAADERLHGVQSGWVDIDIRRADNGPRGKLD